MIGPIGIAFAKALALFVASHSPFVPITGETIYVSESLATFNADSGDYVIMIMDEFSPDSITRCLNSGGEPIWSPRTNILECDGIDF